MSTEPRIKPLPPLLINKIAAGEVVERPASVVKELLDNAIDAGATRITLTIEEGGKSLIRVTDDGRGMTPEEVEIAVAPHTTSKILCEEDLFNIASMGFRGEALASIAAVSHMRIVSRTPDSDSGAELNIAGVDKRRSNATGCPVGTTIEVRDLFFNVPARRKFLRATSTETGHINEQFARNALAYPEIAFELHNNNRKTHQLPECKDRRTRIGKFYGKELADSLLFATRDERGTRIEAFIAPPERSRATSQWQYTFVNSRYIRDRYVQHAVKESFRGLVEHNRHGVLFLFIDIDPSQVDVNVHPTKIEVRWSDPNLIHSQVLSICRETLRAADLTPALKTDRATLGQSPENQERMRHELALMLKSASTSHDLRQPATDRQWREAGRDVADPLKTWRELYQPVDQTKSEALPATGHDEPTDVTATAPRAVQMHNLYLVVETDDGILIIDQHALHERVMYEQLKEMLDRGPLESQRLLMPVTTRVTAGQLALIKQKTELLEKLGIEIREFGPDVAAVHAFPVLLKNADIEAFVIDLLDRLQQKPGMQPKSGALAEDAVHDVLDMMACKAAVKAGDPLTNAEIEALVNQRHLVDKSSNCPHGRPTTLRLTKADLNRQFKRT